MKFIETTLVFFFQDELYTAVLFSTSDKASLWKTVDCNALNEKSKVIGTPVIFLKDKDIYPSLKLNPL